MGADIRPAFLLQFFNKKRKTKKQSNAQGGNVFCKKCLSEDYKYMYYAHSTQYRAYFRTNEWLLSFWIMNVYTSEVVNITNYFRRIRCIFYYYAHTNLLGHCWDKVVWLEGGTKIKVTQQNDAYNGSQPAGIILLPLIFSFNEFWMGQW